MNTISSYKKRQNYFTPISRNKVKRKINKISFESGIYIFSDHPLDEACRNYTTSQYVNQNLGFNDDFGRQTFVMNPNDYDFTDAYEWGECKDTHKISEPFSKIYQQCESKSISSYKLYYTNMRWKNVIC